MNCYRFIAMSSSFLWQLVSLLDKELDSEYLHWVTYTWSVDSVINMLMIYMSLSVAKKHYKRVCYHCLHCHQCCLSCIIKIVDLQIESKEKQEKKNEAVI